MSKLKSKKICVLKFKYTHATMQLAKYKRIKFRMLKCEMLKFRVVMLNAAIRDAEV